MEQTSDKSTAQAPEWSDADKKWLDDLAPQYLRQTAERYGRRLFTLVMVSGVCTHAFGLLARHTAGNRACAVPLQILGHHFNDMMSELARQAGADQMLFSSCQSDIERISVIAEAARKGGEAKSPGGILLSN